MQLIWSLNWIRFHQSNDLIFPHSVKITSIILSFAIDLETKHYDMSLCECVNRNLFIRIVENETEKSRNDIRFQFK